MHDTAPAVTEKVMYGGIMFADDLARSAHRSAACSPIGSMCRWNSARVAI